MLSSTMDQAVIIPNREIADALAEVQSLVEEAVITGSDYTLVQKTKILRQAAQVRGIALASLLYEWSNNTLAFGVGPDDWEDHVKQQTGYSEQTIRKYIEAWKALKAAPEHLFPLLVGKQIEGLIKLPAAVREGQLDDEDWDRIANAATPREIHDIVREARGKATNSESAVNIVWDRNGMLHVYRGGEHDVVGYLKPINEILTEFGKIAVERMVNSSGVRRE